MSEKTISERPAAPYLAWLSAALLFFYQYIIRVAPGAMVEDLRLEFGFTATEFSYLGALFLYGYALMQVPFGIIIDRIGVRQVLLISTVFCVSATFAFASTQSPWVALISRFILGIGASTPFICCLKIASERMPTNRKGFFSGSVLAIGTIGALCSGAPLSMLMEQFGWRGSLKLATLIGVGIFILTFTAVPKKSPETRSSVESKEKKSVLKLVMTTIKNRDVMLYGIVAVGLYTPLSVLADLWGTAFLMEKYGLSQSDAAQATLSVYAGMMVGSFFLAWFAQRINRLNGTIRVCGILMVVSFALLLYGPVIPSSLLTALMMFIGFLCGAEMVCFTGVTAITSTKALGLTLAVVNTLNMVGGALLQKAVGFGLDWQWEGVLADNGLRYYSTEQFIWSMSSLFVIMIVCILAAFKLRGR